MAGKIDRVVHSKTGVTYRIHDDKQAALYNMVMVNYPKNLAAPMLVNWRKQTLDIMAERWGYPMPEVAVKPPTVVTPNPIILPPVQQQTVTPGTMVNPPSVTPQKPGVTPQTKPNDKPSTIVDTEIPAEAPKSKKPLIIGLSVAAALGILVFIFRKKIF